MSHSETAPARVCDNQSVGVIITDGAGRYLVFDRNTYPPGVAACAGHLDGLSDQQAATAEVGEELGLSVEGLLPVARGWRTNMCRRAPGPRGVGHQWTVFRATVRGQLSPSPRETRNARWITRADLQALYARTLAFLAAGALTPEQFEAQPGLDPVWARWYAAAGALDATAEQLDLIDAWSWPAPTPQNADRAPRQGQSGQVNERVTHGVGTIALPGGARVARVGVGGWPIGGPDQNLGMAMGWSTATEAAARAGLERAYTLGANLFDTADVYGHGRSERLIGTLLAQVPRAQVAVCGKTGYFVGTAPHGYDPRHMRRQLEQSLENLGTDYLDVYALHHHDFGPEDRYLDRALEAMRAFQREGLVRAIGMRGPHRYAPDRLSDTPRHDKHARFRALFDRVRPEVLATRFNLLTPTPPGEGIFEFAARHGVPVLITKPLAQGLLTGKHTAAAPPVYGPGDHRARKRWFTPAALAILQQEMAPLREHFGGNSAALVRVALRYCLQRAHNTALLVGFTTAEQVETNLTCLGEPLTDQEIALAAEIGRRAQTALDAAGQVFLDERAAAQHEQSSVGGSTR